MSRKETFCDLHLVSVMSATALGFRSAALQVLYVRLSMARFLSFSEIFFCVVFQKVLSLRKRSSVFIIIFVNPRFLRVLFHQIILDKTP